MERMLEVGVKENEEKEKGHLLLRREGGEA